MRNLLFVLALLSFTVFTACEKDEFTIIKDIDDVSLKVSFGSTKAVSALKDVSAFTYETPENYYVALKKVTLLGSNDTPDFNLFNEPNLSSSFVFDYTDDEVVHSLLKDAAIPAGEYSSIEVEIYYLQMNIGIATGDRGIERRNVRIYLSDDAETEDGLHQPGDMTQINEGQEMGWLLGEGQMPNMDPVAPRHAAYTFRGEGQTWYDFAGKSGADYGPFGDVEFMSKAPHPIYSTEVKFNFVDNNGSNLVLDFNVEDCWQFEDKSGDGYFGADDMDPENPTKWHMAMPEMTVTLE